MNDSSLNKFYYSIGSKLVEANNITNLSITKELSFASNFSLGQAISPMQINSPQEIKISFDRDYTQKDDLLQYTGANSYIEDAYLFDGNKFYELSDLFLTNYSASFSVGELPKIKTSFVSFGGDISQVYNMNTFNKIIEYPTFDVPKLNSISLSGIQSQDNVIKNIYNIVSFDYSIEANWQPFYGIGSGLRATEVCPILPLIIKFSVTSKVKNEQSITDIPKIINNNLNFDIVVTGAFGKTNYEIRNAQMVQTDIISNSNDVFEIRRNFLGYYGI